jgi:hypothetical protein
MSWLDALIEENACLRTGGTPVAEVGSVVRPMAATSTAPAPDEDLYAFEERAGILGFQAGFSRVEAERRANLQCPERPRASK